MRNKRIDKRLDTKLSFNMEETELQELLSYAETQRESLSTAIRTLLRRGLRAEADRQAA
jgi:hypothetical protein